MNTLGKIMFGPICFLCYTDIIPLITGWMWVDLHFKVCAAAEQTVDVILKIQRSRAWCYDKQSLRGGGFPGGSVTKNPPANARDTGSISGSGRSPGEENGSPLQYSCVGHPKDRGAWWATVRRVTQESDMTSWLNNSKQYPQRSNPCPLPYSSQNTVALHQGHYLVLIARSCPTLCDPMDCSPRVLLFMEFSRQDYWSGLPFPSPGDLPDPGIEDGSPKFRADSSPTEPQGKHWCTLVISKGWSDLLYLANILTKEGSSILLNSFILQPVINKQLKLNSKISQRTFFCCWVFSPILLIIIPCFSFFLPFSFIFQNWDGKSIDCYCYSKHKSYFPRFYLLDPLRVTNGKCDIITNSSS